MDLGLLVGLVITGACIIWICGLAVSFVRGRAKLRSFVRVPGMVVDVHAADVTTSGATGNAPAYAPVLAFRTLDGRDVQTEGSFASSTYAGKTGQQVSVVYDPENPNEAYIGTATGTPLFVYAIGIAIAAIGLVVGLAILHSRLG